MPLDAYLPNDGGTVEGGMGNQGQALPVGSERCCTSGKLKPQDLQGRVGRLGESDSIVSGTGGNGNPSPDVGSLERPGDSQRQRPTALQAVAPADSSPGHSIDLAESAPWGGSDLVTRPPSHGSVAGSIDYDRWQTPAPPPLITFVAWYRHRAEELGDFAADMMSEGLDGIAYGQARRAAHYGRIANELYAARAVELKSQHPAWFRPGHGNFL